MKIAVCAAILLLPVAARADLVYTIGNSLTGMSDVWRLDGTVEWHIDCGKSLPYINSNPEAPCVASSHLWTDALTSTQYDFLSVQPFAGSTLGQDVDVISSWLALQPSAVLVIHTGWTHHAFHESDYHSPHSGNLGDAMDFSPEYFEALMSRLHSLDPSREIRSTRMNDILDVIYHDVDEGNAPYASFDELYADSIHLTETDGRYLAHNAMRIALGQPQSEVGYSAIDPAHKAYLDGVLARVTAVPESGTMIALAMGLGALGVVIRSRLAG